MTSSLRHVLAVAALLAVAPAALADTASHRKAAEDLLKEMGVDKQLQSSISQMLDIQVRSNPQLEPFRDTMKAFFTKQMSWASLKDDFITIYTDAFTESELNDIRAFYRTPTGKKMVEKTPELMSKGMKLGASRVEANQGELQQMIREKASKGAPRQ